MRSIESQIYYSANCSVWIIKVHTNYICNIILGIDRLVMNKKCMYWCRDQKSVRMKISTALLTSRTISMQGPIHNHVRPLKTFYRLQYRRRHIRAKCWSQRCWSLTLRRWLQPYVVIVIKIWKEMNEEIMRQALLLLCARTTTWLDNQQKDAGMQSASLNKTFIHSHSFLARK